MSDFIVRLISTCDQISNNHIITKEKEDKHYENQVQRNPFDEIIRYRIEATHIIHQIDMIMEGADEVGEAYEFAEWMDGDPKGNSIMGVVDCLETASSRATTVMINAENKLKAILDLAIENGDERLSKYKGTDYKDKLGYVVERLYERFTDIYDYTMKEQIN